MLSHLLSVLFGKKDPQTALKKRLKEVWQPWFEAISEDRITGEDPTYNDDFLLIKEEITKLSGIDAPLITEMSEQLLKQKSKDIRLATYYAWGRLKTDGVEGFADGLELIAGLIDTFGDDLYPSRESIRKNALEWLASGKFTEILDNLQPFEKEHLERMIAALNMIDLECKKIFVSAPPDFGSLIQFFASGLAQPVVIKSANNTNNVAASETPASPVISDSKVQIRSTRDIVEQARKMAVYLREKPEGYLPASRLLRTIRWDMLDGLPPSDNKSRTRLPAPRAELRQHLNRLLIQRQWTELLEMVERAFMEAANHFWLDLQRYAYTALQQMGEPYVGWCDIATTDVALMLERLKGIEYLSFDDGSPFADDETLSWIALSATVHHIEEDGTLLPIPVSGSEDNWGEMEQQAIEIAERDGLEAALRWLQGLSGIVSARQRYLLRFLKARVAEKNGQRDVAIRILSLLNNDRGATKLEDWEPDLIFDIKARLLKLVKQKSQLKDADKVLLSQQIEQLHNELTELNPAKAIAL